MGADGAQRGPRLPDFPWDSLAETTALAAQHPDGVVNLSVGTPVDDVPEILRAALTSMSNRPGYPATHGTESLREAVVASLQRRYGTVEVPAEAVLPTIGSKELVAWLPALLGLRAGDLVAIPELAYPTYEVGAKLAGADVVRLAPGEPVPDGTSLLWLNSPSNPTGQVLDAELMASAVESARAVGAVVASDECYLALGWDSQPVSVLHPSVCQGALDRVLAVHSLSKTSNLAGYRAGFVAGDPALISRLLELRKHAGMIMPWPVQGALTAGCNDDAHVTDQCARYAARRERLHAALTAAGFDIEHSAAGLYLWASRGEDAWQTVEWLARQGILVAPGTFYGPAGKQHVRIALTASDERIAAAAHRLSETPRR